MNEDEELVVSQDECPHQCENRDEQTCTICNNLVILDAENREGKEEKPE